jgi:hypothetical protein
VPGLAGQSGGRVRDFVKAGVGSDDRRHGVRGKRLHGEVLRSIR